MYALNHEMCLLFAVYVANTLQCGVKFQDLFLELNHLKETFATLLEVCHWYIFRKCFRFLQESKETFENKLKAC